MDFVWLLAGTTFFVGSYGLIRLFNLLSVDAGEKVWRWAAEKRSAGLVS